MIAIEYFLKGLTAVLLITLVVYLMVLSIYYPLPVGVIMLIVLLSALAGWVWYVIDLLRGRV